MGAEVSIPEIKSHRLFLDLFSAFRAPCPSSLSCFFFRLLAVPSIVVFFSHQLTFKKNILFQLNESNFLCLSLEFTNKIREKTNSKWRGFL